MADHMSTGHGKAHNQPLLTFVDEGLMKTWQPHQVGGQKLGRHLPNLDGERIGAWCLVVAGVQATVDAAHAAHIHRLRSTVLDSHSDRVRHLQFKGHPRPTRQDHHGQHWSGYDAVDLRC